MGEKYSTANNDKLKETIGNDSVMQNTTFKTDLSDQNSNSGKLQNVDYDTKHKNDQKNSLNEEGEVAEKRTEKEEEESVLTLKSNITTLQPVPLIRCPSEEGFHQVVKFTKHATRRGEAEFPERKSSSTPTESSKQEKSSKNEDICILPIENDSTNQKLDNCIICTEQELDANIQIQPECYDSADKICSSKSASINIDNHSLNCSVNELKSLNDESICAESKETYETMNLIEDDKLSNLQQEDDEEEICQENCDLQTEENEKSETFVLSSLNLQNFS